MMVAVVADEGWGLFLRRRTWKYQISIVDAFTVCIRRTSYSLSIIMLTVIVYMIVLDRDVKLKQSKQQLLRVTSSFDIIQSIS